MGRGNPVRDAGGPEPRTRRVHFYGSGGTLFGIHVVNVLLTLVTLGVYYFWAKVRIRAYLLGQTEVEGDRFAFHGRGRELLVGWLKALAIFGLPLLVLGTAPELLGAGQATRVVAGVLSYTVILVFLPVAMVGARRYRLSRTSWRGIRLSFRGRTVDFIRLFVGGALLSMVTLGLFYPFFEARRYAFMTSHAYFGNRPFRFDGRGWDLFVSYAIAAAVTIGGGAAVAVAIAVAVWVVPALVPAVVPETVFAAVAFAAAAVSVGTLVVAGLVWFWLSARKQRYFWDHTGFGSARFRSTVTGRALLKLTVGNVVLLILTLGLAWPWVTVRRARFAVRYLAIEGDPDLAGVQQDAQTATATGEELAGFLDVGFDLG